MKYWIKRKEKNFNYNSEYHVYYHSLFLWEFTLGSGKHNDQIWLSSLYSCKLHIINSCYYQIYNIDHT